jgi:hypothetical protein
LEWSGFAFLEMTSEASILVAGGLRLARVRPWGELNGREPGRGRWCRLGKGGRERICGRKEKGIRKIGGPHRG